MAITFTGVNINAKDPVKSYEFYKGLGMRVKTEAAPDDEWYGASFDLGGGTLWIWRDHDGVSASEKPPIIIVLTSGDMDSDYAALKAADYAVTAPETMFYGGREMHLTDPDGNQLLVLN
ncbi:MAG: VOC family protein [Oscillospiraceae bacterium]|jgi:predicted enzyme related to lactoylglutathione lyase|nr:VOC family protein [Oscillospiraceae bacterium]